MPTEERISALHEQSLTLVEKIKAAKQQQGKTVQQLADETGIPRTTLNRFFAGTLMNPGFMDVCALCASLELSADELIGLSPQKSDDSVTVDFCSWNSITRTKCCRKRTPQYPASLIGAGYRRREYLPGIPESASKATPFQKKTVRLHPRKGKISP